MKNKNQEDWRGEKGKYYDYGFEDGKKEAKKEFKEMIQEIFYEEHQFKVPIVSVDKVKKLLQKLEGGRMRRINRKKEKLSKWAEEEISKCENILKTDLLTIEGILKTW